MERGLLHLLIIRLIISILIVYSSFLFLSTIVFKGESFIISRQWYLRTDEDLSFKINFGNNHLLGYTFGEQSNLNEY